MPDHSDFKKSRIALLSTSIILFILSNVNLLSDSITILGLEIEVDKNNLLILWRLIVCYFIYIYMGRSSNEYQDLKFSRGKREAEYLKNQGRTENSQNPEVYMLEPLIDKRNAVKHRVKLFIDLTPPILISVVALSYSLI